MDLKVTDKKDNVLLSRTEVSGELGFNEATPSKVDLAGQVAKSLNAKKELIVVKNINANFGAKKANFSVFVYKDEAALKKYEPEHAIKRNKLDQKPEEKKEEKPAEKPAEEKKQEEPAKQEAPKQEAKPEEKKEEAK